VPLTIDDLAHHLNADDPPPEGEQARVEMQRALDTAVQETTRITGMPGDTPVAVEVSAARGDRVLLLPYVRLTAVAAVLDPARLPVTPRAVDLRAGVVELPGPSTDGTYTATVTGRPWPSALETAALDWATHVYDTQRTVINPVSGEDTPSPTFALPNRVEELLHPYRLPGIA
jgi:hypothetical protein